MGTASDDPARTTIAGRYQLIAPLGSGGFGSVWRAFDPLADREVAVKRFADGAVPALIRREVSALRLLRLPGVAHLLDEGVDDDGAFLVLELADGAPFPGEVDGRPRRGWDALEPMMRDLCEIVSRVHGVGVLHRDLKPANVLVDAEGRVTVLDFGLSAGAAVDPTLSGPSAGSGTLRYAAPEQLLGQQPTAASDVYSLGAMLYEALAGFGPHMDLPEDEQLGARTSSPPTGLEALLLAGRIEGAAADDEAVACAARAVDAMLAVRAPERPRSVALALRMLHGEGGGRVGTELPRLGGTAQLEQAADALAAGRSVRVTGQSGSGRTRFLADLEALLHARGLDARRLVPGDEPFESLEPFFDDFGAAGEEAQTLEEARRVAHAGVLAAVERGEVVLVDEPGELDEETLALLSQLPANARTARTETPDSGETTHGPEAERIELTPLTEEALRDLFAGPDLLLHLATDAARELYERTGGLPSDASLEVDSWVRAGLATWAGDCIAIDRGAIARLEAGLGVRVSHRSAEEMGLDAEQDRLLFWITTAVPNAGVDILERVVDDCDVRSLIDGLVSRRAIRQRRDGVFWPIAMTERAPTADERRAAHQAIADALPEGVRGRLRQLVAADALVEAARELPRTCRRLMEQGRVDTAFEDALHVLACVRSSPEGVRIALRELCFAAYHVYRPEVCDRALYEMSRFAESDAEITNLERLMRSAGAALVSNSAVAFEIADEIEPFDEPALEHLRHTCRIRAVRSAEPERMREELDRLRAEELGPDARAATHEAHGLVLYRESRFDEAANEHSQAVAMYRNVPSRFSASLNHASALIDALRPTESLAILERVRSDASEMRNTLYEARAMSLSAAARARMDDIEWLANDATDLLLALESLGDDMLGGYAGIHVAGAAWRAEAHELRTRAFALAIESYGRLQVRWPLLLLHCLEACALDGEGFDLDALAGEARECPYPRLSAQCLALLRRCGIVLRQDDVDRIGAVVESIPAARRHVSLEVLAPSALLADTPS